MPGTKAISVNKIKSLPSWNLHPSREPYNKWVYLLLLISILICYIYYIFTHVISNSDTSWGKKKLIKKIWYWRWASLDGVGRHSFSRRQYWRRDKSYLKQLAWWILGENVLGSRNSKDKGTELRRDLACPRNIMDAIARGGWGGKKSEIGQGPDYA